MEIPLVQLMSDLALLLSSLILDLCMLILLEINKKVVYPLDCQRRLEDTL